VAIKLSDVNNRTTLFWRTLGNKFVRLMKDMTAAGLDYEGRKFPPYSDKQGPAWLAAQGWDNRSYKERKADGVAAPRQSSRQTDPPNLMLTGDMLRDLKVVATNKTHALVGWTAWGDRAKWNADMGRAMIDFDSINNPHPRMADVVEQACAIDTEEKLNKWAAEPLEINIKKP